MTQCTQPYIIIYFLSLSHLKRQIRQSNPAVTHSKITGQWVNEGYFSLSRSVSRGNYSMWQIWQDRPLDREKQHLYEVKVHALDKDGNDVSVATVRINVLDRNDNHPVFDRRSLSAHLREDFTGSKRLTCDLFGSHCLSLTQGPPLPGCCLDSRLLQ